MTPEPTPIVAGQRYTILGDLYVGTPCESCKVVFAVLEQALYDNPDSLFYCADCGPPE